MVYGNKFLDNNVLLSESLLIKEEENINLLINDLDIVAESQDPIDRAYDFLFDKIGELCDKINFYISKFISFVKVKILKLGNKILKKLDEVINDKFEVKDLPAIETEYKKDFDNGGEYKEIVESVITESDSEKKVSFVSFKSPRTLINDWTDYTTKDLEKAEDFMGVAQKYLDDSVEYLKGNHTDTLKNKLDAYRDQFDNEKYEELKTKEKEKDDLVYGLIYDIKEVKSGKNEQFTTTNGYFKVDFVDISNKENMKELRSLVFSQIKYLENQIEVLSKSKSKIEKVRQTVNSFTNKSRRVINNNNYGSGSSFDSPSHTYRTIDLKDVTYIGRKISNILARDYKACTSLINASVYVTKSNYHTAIQSIKFWGENTQKEQK